MAFQGRVSSPKPVARQQAVNETLLQIHCDVQVHVRLKTLLHPNMNSRWKFDELQRRPNIARW